jgi:hypothetical protein
LLFYPDLIGVFWYIISSTYKINFMLYGRGAMKSIRAPRVYTDFLPVAVLFILIPLHFAVLARPNLALSRTAKASSVQSADLAPAYAVDGNVSTRWSSLSSDSQWIFVDLGQKDTIDSVFILWENSAAKEYYIQAWSSESDTPSYNDNGWTNAAQVTNGLAAEKRSITFTPTPARYVRMRSVSRVLTYGVSLFELEIYGNTPACPLPAITKQPVNTIGIIGLPVPFRIAAIGKDLSYQWQRSNDKGLTWPGITSDPSATTATYTFTPATSDSGAQFRCVVSSPCGIDTSKAVVLSVSKTKPPRTNIALNTVAKCSAIQNAFLAELAVDGVKSQASRWASAGGDSSWIFVDLGAKYSIDSLAIYWEHAGAKKYCIQTWGSDADTPSYNDNGWTTILTDTTLFYQPPPVDMCLSYLHFPATTTRYVRVRCYTRLTGYGCSIFELEVFGNLVPTVSSPRSRGREETPTFDISTQKGGVEFTQHGSTSFTCEIFSANGKFLRRLVAADAAVWDYRDRFGTMVPNGMYLVRISVENKTIQEKIAICR